MTLSIPKLLPGFVIISTYHSHICIGRNQHFLSHHRFLRYSQTFRSNIYIYLHSNASLLLSRKQTWNIFPCKLVRSPLRMSACNHSPQTPCILAVLIPDQILKMVRYSSSQRDSIKAICNMQLILKTCRSLSSLSKSHRIKVKSEKVRICMQ